MLRRGRVKEEGRTVGVGRGGRKGEGVENEQHVIFCSAVAVVWMRRCGMMVWMGWCRWVV